MKKWLLLGTFACLSLFQCKNNLVEQTATGRPDNVSSSPATGGSLDAPTKQVCQSIGKQIACKLGGASDTCRDRAAFQEAVSHLQKTGVTTTGLPSNPADCNLSCIDGTCQYP